MQQTIDFLTTLAAHNEREWFNANKATYQAAEAEFKALAQQVHELMGAYDVLEEKGTKVYRIYRDVRFSKDKSPYKTNRSCSFTRAGAARRGGYYLSVQPGNSFLAGGFWQPNTQDLKHIRQQLAQDHEPLDAVVQSDAFKAYFGKLGGDQVKTAPKGYEKDHPAIHLLRHKGFLVQHNFTDAQVLAPDFAQQVADGFKQMRPFLDVMTELLTTDLNGVPLLEEEDA